MHIDANDLRVGQSNTLKVPSSSLGEITKNYFFSAFHIVFPYFLTAYCIADQSTVKGIEVNTCCTHDIHP